MYAVSHCMEHFGDRLKLLRTENNLSQEELARELGVAKGSLCNYENGKRTPDITFLETVSKYFAVSPDYLLGVSDNKTNNVTVDAICKYTGLSVNAANNLHQISESGKDINLLFELNDISNLVECLCEIKEIATDKGYYEKVVCPICLDEKFKDDMELDDIKICALDCGLLTHYGDSLCCDGCHHLKTEKTYILDLLSGYFHRLCENKIQTRPYLEGRVSDYVSASDVAEFRTMKAMNEIISAVKVKGEADTKRFREYNTWVRGELEDERNEITKLLPQFSDDIAEQCKTELAAINKFLEQYDDDFNKKKAGD